MALLDEHALKKGIPAPQSEPMPLPEKITFTRTSYTVVVPPIRNVIKSLMRQYQGTAEFTQLERDKHTAQLIAASEQLSGAAYTADYDTSQVLNDAARAAELAAFMIAEHSDAKTVSESLRSIFVTLTPLTQKELVALKTPTGTVAEWSEQHFTLIKYKIESALERAENPKARELYQKALSHVNTAELYRKSDQKYWNSSADMKEAIRTIGLAAALERSYQADTQEGKEAVQKQQAKEAILKTKSAAEKSLWGSFLNLLGM
jgi:hypothetical protein